MSVREGGHLREKIRGGWQGGGERQEGRRDCG